ncbi:hypothetical protein G9444_4748 [Rhodococcus erythropolis]|uniref:Uncharacterized protein n=1 Tax=Rhodococcus erythropolis TaxID=1833 RepID=A0A6G9CZG7_RHOER|nr:hypothetical protein G9444_4748 [Rhodococcus erythropolis]
MSKAANANVYALVIHCRSTVVARSSRARVGIAVLRMVLSIVTTTRDVQRAPSAAHRRRSVGSREFIMSLRM